MNKLLTWREKLKSMHSRLVSDYRYSYAVIIVQDSICMREAVFDAWHII